jgi:hypothetical protein
MGPWHDCAATPYQGDECDKVEELRAQLATEQASVVRWVDEAYRQSELIGELSETLATVTAERDRLLLQLETEKGGPLMEQLALTREQRDEARATIHKLDERALNDADTNRALREALEAIRFHAEDGDWNAMQEAVYLAALAPAGEGEFPSANMAWEDWTHPTPEAPK